MLQTYTALMQVGGQAEQVDACLFLCITLLYKFAQLPETGHTNTSEDAPYVHECYLLLYTVLSTAEFCYSVQDQSFLIFSFHPNADYRSR